MDPFMARALELAARGVGTASPNPCVGAVIVRDGRIVGEGFHRKAGEPHAEIHALRAAGDRARGATLYVTLEPCAHTGRTGPCAGAVVEAGIAEAVVAHADPNPQVAGRGLSRLREAGIRVRLGEGESEARRLNEAFLFAVARGRPWLHLKWAMTLDGKSATASGESKWITGPAARARVHRMRAEADAVLVGGETLRADDPALTVRDFAWGDDRELRQPERIVVTNRPVDLERRLFAGGPGVTVLFGADPGAGHRAALADRGVRAEVYAGEGGLDWDAALRSLGERDMRSVLVEAGPTLAGVLLRGCLAQRVTAFVSPRILGGAHSRPAVGGPDPLRLAEAKTLVDTRWEAVGDDWMLTGLLPEAAPEGV